MAGANFCQDTVGNPRQRETRLIRQHAPSSTTRQERHATVEAGAARRDSKTQIEVTTCLFAEDSTCGKCDSRAESIEQRECANTHFQYLQSIIVDDSAWPTSPPWPDLLSTAIPK